jgi:hypothetical protein
MSECWVVYRGPAWSWVRWWTVPLPTVQQGRCRRFAGVHITGWSGRSVSTAAPAVRCRTDALGAAGVRKSAVLAAGRCDVRPTYRSQPVRPDLRTALSAARPAAHP